MFNVVKGVVKLDTAKAFLKLFDNAVGIDIENLFDGVGVVYEGRHIEQGKLKGIINPTIESGTKDKAFIFDDKGMFNIGGVGGAVNLDGIMYRHTPVTPAMKQGNLTQN